MTDTTSTTSNKSSRRMRPLAATKAVLLLLLLLLAVVTLAPSMNSVLQQYYGHYNNMNKRKRRMAKTPYGMHTMDEFEEQEKNQSHTTAMFSSYKLSPAEKFVLEHIKELDFDTSLDSLAEGCKIWRHPEFRLRGNRILVNEIYQDLQTYKSELKEYYSAIEEYTYLRDQKITDLRPYLDQNKSICKRLGDNIQNSFFAASRQLSYSPQSGWMEPLLAPLRHPNLCFHREGDPETLDAFSVEYLVHDFARACERLHPTSRVVLFDLGATRKFWELYHPGWSLVRLWEHFGFRPDHIYAFETTRVPWTVEHAYEHVPGHLQASYHWIHADIETEVDHPLNPFTLLQQEFTPDDLVLFKMDIGPSHKEEQLMEQLMQSRKLQSLIDHLYYEHKVHLLESSRAWGGQMIGSVADSLQMFAKLRDMGVAAHYWV